MREVDLAIEDLATVGGLPHPTEAEAIWDGIWYEETHNSTAIEGNTIILREVERLLQEGKAVGSKELGEYLEVEGYARAARWTYGQAVAQASEWCGRESINLTELRQFHRQVVEPAWLHAPLVDLLSGEGPGAFRQHDIRPFPSAMTPPPFPQVPALVAEWLAAVNSGPADGQHPMQFVAETHAAFERVHPFRDGNGRTGRLASNLVLVRHGYPPAVILKRHRQSYLNALKRADDGDADPLASIFARAVTDSVYRFLLPRLAGSDRLVPLRALADADLSANALVLAMQRGRLRAVRRADQWHSSKRWVQDYKNSRYKRSSA